MRAIFGALVVTVAIVLLSREAMPQRKISPDIMAMLRRFVEQLKESKGTHSLPPGFIFPEELTVKTAATPTTESPTQKPVQGKSGEQISKPTGDYCDEQTQETFQGMDKPNICIFRYHVLFVFWFSLKDFVQS